METILHVKRVDDGISDQKCSICFEALKDRKTSETTCCHHLFHTQCIFQWLSDVPKCPKCDIICLQKKPHYGYVWVSLSDEERRKTAKAGWA